MSGTKRAISNNERPVDWPTNLVDRIPGNEPTATSKSQPDSQEPPASGATGYSTTSTFHQIPRAVIDTEKGYAAGVVNFGLGIMNFANMLANAVTPDVTGPDGEKRPIFREDMHVLSWDDTVNSAKRNVKIGLEQHLNPTLREVGVPEIPAGSIDVKAEANQPSDVEASAMQASSWGATLAPIVGPLARAHYGTQIISKAAAPYVASTPALEATAGSSQAVASLAKTFKYLDPTSIKVAKTNITVRLEYGIGLDDAARELIQLAKTAGKRVTVNLNGMRVVVEPNFSSVDDVTRAFTKAEQMVPPGR